MFEREAGLVMDRFGLDSDAIGRVMDAVAAVSAEAVRPLASALGIADAAAVEALARDVRALLQGEARLRREQGAATVRLDELLAAVEALGATTARLADLQARTQDRLDSLADRAAAIDGTDQQRQRLSDEVRRLSARIDQLEAVLAADAGPGLADAAEGSSQTTGIRPSGARRAAPRSLKTSATQKILEGLPNLEPKIRPA
ncbi:MAG: hypothetical protein ABR587_02055 [Candidatus Binatia bacterium]